jgi:lysozyme family protein
MEKNFHRALEFVFKWEGGYTSKEKNEPETNYGITKDTYPDIEIESITKDKAEELYKVDFWNKVGGPTLPFPFDVIAFDTAINCGPGRAIKWLGEAKTGHQYLFLRLEHYTKQKKKWKKNGRGWVNRVVDLYKLIEEMKG